MRNMFTGERLPSPIFAPLERGGGGEESDERVVRNLVSSKFMEPGRYKLPGVREPAELWGLPEDLDREFESFEELRRFVSENYDLFAMWMHLGLARKWTHSKSLSEEAASGALIAYLDFLNDKKVKPKRKHGRLMEWFLDSKGRTYRNFRTKSVRYIWYRFGDQANRALHDATSYGISETIDPNEKYRRLAKDYEAAKGKLAVGQHLLGFEKEAIEEIESGRDRDGRSSRVPATFVPMVKATASDGEEGQQYEPHYEELDRDRIYMLPAEEAERIKLLRLATDFDQHTTWNIKIKKLSDLLSKFERELENERKEGNNKQTHDQEYQILMYKAVINYEDRRIKDSSVTRKGVAGEFFTGGEDMAKIAESMGSIWTERNKDYKKWLTRDETEKLTFEENLLKMGISLERLLDEIPGDTYIKERFLKTLRGDKA